MRLLRNEVRWKRGLALSPDCSKCDESLEDCLDPLWDSVASAIIWHFVLLPPLLHKFFSLPYGG